MRHVIVVAVTVLGTTGCKDDPLAGPRAELIGTWSEHHIAGELSVLRRFEPGGAYTFTLGVGEPTEESHPGRFRLRADHGEVHLETCLVSAQQDCAPNGLWTIEVLTLTEDFAIVVSPNGGPSTTWRRLASDSPPRR